MQSAANILLDEQNRDAALAHRSNHLEYLPHDHWGKSERGFIKHQRSRPRHQRTADCQHLLLAAAQCRCAVFLLLLQYGEERVDLLECRSSLFRRAALAPKDIAAQYEIVM